MHDFLVSLGVDRWVLPVLIGWPVVAAVLVRLLGRDTSRERLGTEAPSGGPDARTLTAAALVVEGLLTLALWGVFDPARDGWQARWDLPWLPDFGSTVSLGVDGLSLPLVLMTGVVLPVAFIASWDNVRVRTPAFGALALLLTSGLMGVFVALDLLVFYLAWELMLIPTYLLVGVWSTAGNTRASLRYVLFTLVGSLLMLVAIIALWSVGDGSSMHLDALSTLTLSPTAQLLMFGAFFAAFGVKSALFPFHTWLPDAQQVAPTFASVTLGLKVGAYAMLRFAIPLFPAAATHDTVRMVILVLSVVSIVYGALVAMAQKDLKRLISYSSISHLGFIMMGCFTLTQQSVEGAVMSIVNSGLATSALFLVAGMLEDRTGSTSLDAFGGMARRTPMLATMLVVAMLSTVALPGTAGFVGEFLVLIGTYAEFPVLAVVATTGVVFAAAYGLKALQGVLFGPFDAERHATLRDLGFHERAALVVLAAGIVAVGVAPAPVLKRLDRPTQSLIEAVRFGPNAPAPTPPVSLGR